MGEVEARARHVATREVPGGPAWLVVFDGQSHNNVPAGRVVPDDPVLDALALDTNPGMPAYVMTGRGVPWRYAAMLGTSWTALDATKETRCFRWAKEANRTVLVMNGGTTDINEGDTGADLYAEEVAYAMAARAAGFDHVVACTLVPSRSFSAGQHEERIAHNAALLTDVFGAFDGVADFAAVPGLDDHTDCACYFDGVHWWHTGAALAAACLAPVLDALLGFPQADHPRWEGPCRVHRDAGSSRPRSDATPPHRLGS